MQGFNAFADPLYPKVTGIGAGGLRQIKANARVADGKAKSSIVDASCHHDRLRMAMPHRVDDEFPDDADQGMGRVVGQAPARDGKSYREPDAFGMGRKGASERLIHGGLIQGAIAQVPNAVPQLAAAGVQRLQRQIELPVGLIPVGIIQAKHRAQLHGGPREALDYGVVQFGGQPRSLMDLEFGCGFGD